MTSLFVAVFNMSLTGAFVILAIFLARLILRKGPRSILYFLWIAAGFRLAFPFSFESVLSFMPFSNQLIPTDITHILAPYAQDSYTTNFFGSSSLHNILAVASLVWIAGFVLMLTRGAYIFIKLKSKLSVATKIEDNIYVSDNLKTPFVMGLFTPKIFLPAHLSTLEQKYIILHEQVHIKRGDHVSKYIAYLLLCIHWFNPFVWLAFSLMNRDMEMACDERTLNILGGGTEVKKDYSFALLTLATKSPLISGITPAFNHGDLGSRVKNVLHYKKQSHLVFIVSIAMVLILSMGLSFDRLDLNPTNKYTVVGDPLSSPFACPPCR